MATYYVDPTAQYDGNGLGPDPAASPGALGARNVWPTTLANNTYLGKRGTSYQQTGGYISVNNAVIMGSYGDESLAKHEIWSDGTNSVAVWVYASTSAQISDLKFNGGSTRPFSVGASALNLTVANCDMSGTRDGVTTANAAGWMDGGATPTGMGPVLFQNCTFSNSKLDNFYAQDIANTTFDNCHFYAPQQIDPGVAWANGGGDCIQISSNAQATLNNITIKNCRLINHYGGKHALIIGADTGTTSTGIRVQDCELVGGAVVLNIRASNTIVQRCSLTAYGDYWSRGNTTSEMIRVGSNGSNGLLLQSMVVDGDGLSANGVKGESNMAVGASALLGVTITGCLTNFVLWDSTLGSTISIKNCAFDNSVAAATSVVSIGPSWTLTANNNSYWQNQAGLLTFLYTANIYATLAAAQGAGYEVGSIVGDQKLDSTYRPLPASPLISAGTHTTYTRDATGIQRPNPPSIGAYDLPTQRRVLDSDPAGW